MVSPSLFLGKSVSTVSRLLGRGYGGTWSGEILLTLSPSALSNFINQVQEAVILVAGTNGKTTTALMVRTILTESNTCQLDEVVHNASGANLKNGLTSAFIQATPWRKKRQPRYAVLEVDENSVPGVLADIAAALQGKKKPQIIIVFLNLFRDQLDRYGEVDSIARKWKESLSLLPKDSVLIANADDPSVVGVADSFTGTVRYFGIHQPALFLHESQHTADASYCPRCGTKLTFRGIYFAHLGIWRCQSCGFSRPNVQVADWKSPLQGLYNEYNTLAAGDVATELGISPERIKAALITVRPAFGRQEELQVDGKVVKILLAKNPAGFDASLRTVLDMNPKVILFVLNDRIPDGRDVSWIWDTNIEQVLSSIITLAAGDRAYDMGVRLKYAQKSSAETVSVFGDVSQALADGLRRINPEETVYVLATYSAMLDVRKLLTGRKIL